MWDLVCRFVIKCNILCCGRFDVGVVFVYLFLFV